MIVHYARALQKRIDARGSQKFKPALFHLFCDEVRKRHGSWDLLYVLVVIYDGFAVKFGIKFRQQIAPKIVVKTAKLAHDVEECAGRLRQASLASGGF